LYKRWAQYMDAKDWDGLRIGAVKA
jgi:hypothetical protein